MMAMWMPKSPPTIPDLIEGSCRRAISVMDWHGYGTRLSYVRTVTIWILTSHMDLFGGILHDGLHDGRGAYTVVQTT